MLDSRDIKFFTLAVGSSLIKSISDNNISARCPQCSLDPRWANTKRLHLYKKGDVTNVNCFTGDCSVKNKNIYTYLRDFYPRLLEDYKRETFTDRMKFLASSKDDKPKSTGTDVFASFKKKKNVNIEQLDDPILDVIKPEIQLVNTFDLSPYFYKLDDRKDAQEYFSGRGFEYKILQEKFGKMYVGKGDLEIDGIKYPLNNCIIIPLYYNNKMYGFYSRNINSKQFWTFNQIANIGFKVWNWFNIDLSLPVYIFEGIFDAIGFAISSGNYNVIATMGAQLNKDRVNEIEKSIFCLDNDRSGFKNGLIYVRKGFTVFIQPKSIKYKDMNLSFLAGLECGKLVNDNLYRGIMAEIELQTRL